MKVTQRELDETDLKILQQIEKGKSYKETAYELGITIFMVRNKLTMMRQYYGCTNNTHLISTLRENKSL